MEKKELIEEIKRLKSTYEIQKMTIYILLKMLTEREKNEKNSVR